MRRTICNLFGCELDFHDPCCHRCGAYLYADFLQAGKLEPIFKALPGAARGARAGGGDAAARKA